MLVYQRVLIAGWKMGAPDWVDVFPIEDGDVIPAMWSFTRGYIQFFITYLEPNWPLFLKVNPSKQGLFQSKQGSFRFQVGKPCLEKDVNIYNKPLEKKIVTDSFVPKKSHQAFWPTSPMLGVCWLLFCLMFFVFLSKFQPAPKGT